MKDLELHEAINDGLESCGKAIGFVLAVTLTNPEAFRTQEGARVAIEAMKRLHDSERFSSQVSHAVAGVIAGMEASLTAVARMTKEDPYDPEVII
jgi:hypothetical protein